jgi:hypothetical protein
MRGVNGVLTIVEEICGHFRLLIMKDNGPLYQ